MKHPFKKLLVVCAVVTVSAVTFETTSASAAPKIADKCVSGRICLYANTNYNGKPAMPAHENAKNCLNLAPSIDNKTQAINNKSRFSFEVYSGPGCKPSQYLGHIYANSKGAMSGCSHYDITSVFGDFKPSCTQKFQLNKNISSIHRNG